jgi:hypothetical protein
MDKTAGYTAKSVFEKSGKNLGEFHQYSLS